MWRIEAADQHGLGHLGERRLPAVGEHDDLGAGRRGLPAEAHGGHLVAAHVDGEDHVAGADVGEQRGALLLAGVAHAGPQHLELKRQVTGEDRREAAPGGRDAQARRSEQGNGSFDVGRVEPVERLVDAAGEHGPRPRDRIVAADGRGVAVERRALSLEQLGAQRVLERGEPVEPDPLGESQHGRRAHASLGGEAGNRLEPGDRVVGEQCAGGAQFGLGELAEVLTNGLRHRHDARWRARSACRQHVTDITYCFD